MYNFYSNYPLYGYAHYSSYPSYSCNPYALIRPRPLISFDPWISPIGLRRSCRPCNVSLMEMALSSLQQINDAFGVLKIPEVETSTKMRNFPMNVQDNADSYEIWLNVPAFEKSDIDVSMKDNVLTIKGRSPFPASSATSASTSTTSTTSPESVKAQEPSEPVEKASESVYSPRLNSDNIAEAKVEERTKISEEKSPRMLLNEMPTTSFMRSIRFPSLVDPRNCTSYLDKGVLYLRLPKLPEGQHLPEAPEVPVLPVPLVPTEVLAAPETRSTK